ncbi:MAG: hypothetical protein Udaeo2_32930 [Candidatus Udaeobacter sp.]|nr:MAG: hypothetical protein Udaeo2_32930 [Candidatus Udaeobacter sp.]
MAKYLSSSAVDYSLWCLTKFPVRVNLESRVFTVRFNEDLVVPPAIGIVFPCMVPLNFGGSSSMPKLSE